MEPTSSPQDPRPDEEIITLLKSLGNLKEEYPPEQLAARRANFIAQVQQVSNERVNDPAPSREQFVQNLERLSSVREAYPPELLAARRAAFIAQVEKQVSAKEETLIEDKQMVKLLSGIKSVDALDGRYPPRLFAARRAAFRRQIALGGALSLLDAIRLSIQGLFQNKVNIPSVPGLSTLRTSLVVAILMIAAFAGSLMRIRQPLYSPAPTQGDVAQPGAALASATAEAAKTICKSGYEPPLCLAKGFDKSQDLTYPGNGLARPAVAKDTVPGFSGVHKASYVNDGLYGPGASWVSNSAYSWIKIDLGKPTVISTVTFGRDRLGQLNDGDPGQFVIAVALSDNVYADGNSSRDYVEYTQVYHSKQAGFSGVVSGAETVRADFSPVRARYVKIIFANEKTAVDEVEVFMAQPAVLGQNPTRKPKEEVQSVPATPVPSSTPVPPDTATPVPTDTAVPTDTMPPRPTNTPTDIPPTNTPRPTRTPTDVPTNTPRPTRTPTDVPTNTPRPDPTNTPQPTDTSVPTDPPPTDTPEPPATLTEEPFIPLTETPAQIYAP